jgi:hypothetical protein
MMKYVVCVCCGLREDEVKDDTIIRLKQVPLLRSSFIRKDDEVGTITLCQICSGDQALINLDKIAEADVFRRGQSNTQDDFLYSFLSEYIKRIWAGSDLPSYQDLADALNNIGVLTPTGVYWNHQNLLQKLQRIGFNRRAYLSKREDISTNVEDAIRKTKDLETEPATPIRQKIHIPSGGIQEATRRPIPIVWSDEKTPMPDDIAGIGDKER